VAEGTAVEEAYLNVLTMYLVKMVDADDADYKSCTLMGLREEGN
jgi:hypothetical protein